MNVILLSVVLTIQTCFATPELQTVTVIFRHGDRTPSINSQFPTDPNFGNDYHPIGYGGLTNAGKLRSYELGEFLRKRYDAFLGDVYYPNLLYALSTDVDRTKMSLQLVLAALFAPKNEQKWHKSLNWQPIPTTVIPGQENDILNAVYLDGFKPQAERVRKAMKNQLSKYSEFMSELTNLTGKSINTSLDIKRIYDTLWCELQMNLTLPEWSKEIFPNGKLLEGTLLEFDFLGYDTEFLHYLNGPLFSKITNDMLMAKSKKEIGPKDTKLFLYGAHDNNISNTLQVLQLYKPHVPYFCSAVIIELLKEQDEYYVKVLYYHGNTTQLEELKMPGRSELLPLEKYLSIVNPIVNFNK